MTYKNYIKRREKRYLNFQIYGTKSVSITNIYQRNKEVRNIWLSDMLPLAKVMLERTFAPPSHPPPPPSSFKQESLILIYPYKKMI